MELDLLNTFIIFAKSKNITETAKLLRITQPAVSLQLQRLERTVKHPLFSQEGKRKVLTPFGRAVFEELSPILGQVQGALEGVERRFADPASLSLRIGARAEILSRVVQKIQFPGAIQFVPLGTQKAVDQLLAHEIDIAISYVRPDLTHIHARKIFSDRVQWVCHKSLMKNLSIEKAHASVDFMTENALSCLQAPSAVPEGMVHPSRPNGGAQEIRVHRICEDWNAILKLVEEEQGFSLIPSSIEVKSPSLHSKLLPTEALPEMTFYALYHFDLMKIAAIEKTLSFGS